MNNSISNNYQVYITNLPDLIREASAKTADCIMVVWKTYTNFKEEQKKNKNYSIDYEHIRHLYNEAIDLVSEALERESTTIRDAAERRSNLFACETIRLLQEFFSNITYNNKLKDHLIESVIGKRKECEDKQAIKELFKVIVCLESEIHVEPIKPGCS